MKRTVVVRQGDYLDKIAHRLRLDPDVIWSCEENKALRERRPDPNMLAPGDLLHIPEGDPEPLPLKAQTTNRFTATVPRVQVAFCMEDADGALKNEEYLILGLVRPIEGTTDDEGMVRFEAPVDAREVRLLFPRLAREHPVRIGDLDPIDGGSGLQQRLEHLGYASAARFAVPVVPREHAPPATTDALKEFQLDQGLSPTGVLDDETRKALEKLHRS